MSRVLLTRPEPVAGRTARQLLRLGYAPVVAPMMRMRAIGLAGVPEVPPGAVVAVTSARAIEAVQGTPAWERLRAHPVFAVGEATASAAKDAGALRVEAADGDLGSLCAHLLRARPGSVVYLAGRQRSGDLCAILQANDIPCRMHEVYDMEALAEPPAALVAALASCGPEDPLAVLVYSRRSADALIAALTRLDVHEGLVFFALSDQVAEPLHALGPCHVAAEPSEAALIALLEKTC
ncbi:uroporphyrinogen-III synthase [Stappia stellulata]|uniref:uroporphyrinogen-III synthase n=1 Tax=Stappia stellulata TaxID=71235 RepID=UPI00048A580D|nr:uroporphyrinogen-III synthase [Stappia stellulata]